MEVHNAIHVFKGLLGEVDSVVVFRSLFILFPFLLSILRSIKTSSLSPVVFQIELEDLFRSFLFVNVSYRTRNRHIESCLESLSLDVSDCMFFTDIVVSLVLSNLWAQVFETVLESHWLDHGLPHTFVQLEQIREHSRLSSSPPL